MIARLRDAARRALPEGAFLRRDRGEGLFVTDAPARDPGGDWQNRLTEAGFLVEVTGGLARLTPGAKWLAELEARFPPPPNPFCESLFRFAGMSPEAESLSLFALGAKAREDAEAAARFDRQLRQRAAECLRLNANGPTHGGGLYACALLKEVDT